MEPRKKEQFAVLKQFNDPLYKLNVHRWLRNGWKPNKVVVWLEKRGYLNLKADVKVHYEQHAKRYSTDLRYDNSLLTNKGFDYYDELEELDQKSVTLLWVIIATIAAVVSTGFAIFAWLAATGKIK